jgi:hypothetical protein
MGRQGVEIQVQTIAREDGQTVRGEPVSELVDDRMRRSLRPGTEMQDRNAFRERVHHNPEPEHLDSVAEARAQFVKLEMGQMEMAEPAVVKDGAVFASPYEPGRDRAFTVPKHPHSRRDTQPFGQRG